MKTKIVIVALIVMACFSLNQADGWDSMGGSRMIGIQPGMGDYYSPYRPKTGEVLHVSIRGKEHKGKITAIEKFDIVI